MNIPEILVANGTGALLVIYMFLLRVCTSETDKYRAKLYDAMLVITLTAQITETLSFYWMVTCSSAVASFCI